LAKLKVFGSRATGVTPAPLNCAVCGLLEALSLTVRVPVSEPSAIGVNVTVILHFAPAAKVLGAMGQVEV